jgi:hypothetical protein
MFLKVFSTYKKLKFGSLIGNVRQLVASVVSLEKIVNNNSRKITSLKNISKTQSTRISGENIGAKLPGSSHQM